QRLWLDETLLGSFLKYLYRITTGLILPFTLKTISLLHFESLTIVTWVYFFLYIFWMAMTLEGMDWDNREDIHVVFCGASVLNTVFMLLLSIVWIAGGYSVSFLQDILNILSNNVIVSIASVTAVFTAFSSGIANISIYATCKTYWFSSFGYWGHCWHCVICHYAVVWWRSS
ncbi:MAG: hypothetical protein FWC89_10565, partial [Defluviitaleaceae bacterium]|nr:hypothetical protein [Defluviitaleaceae bacterium]